MYEEKEMYISEIRPGVYLLDEAHEATGFVVIGENKACVIDTMISYTDIGAAVKNITDKPLIVINTHGHPDYIMAASRGLFRPHSGNEQATSHITPGRI
ncbi:MAG: hypothetical protein K6A71_06755 [Lachnospiraceae bacterium]|nr:hypothetical protein [Lachnospiraceae bacterium]